MCVRCWSWGTLPTPTVWLLLSLLPPFPKRTSPASLVWTTTGLALRCLFGVFLHYSVYWKSTDSLFLMSLVCLVGPPESSFIFKRAFVKSQTALMPLSGLCKKKKNIIRDVLVITYCRSHSDIIQRDWGYAPLSAPCPSYPTAAGGHALWRSCHSREEGHHLGQPLVHPVPWCASLLGQHVWQWAGLLRGCQGWHLAQRRVHHCESNDKQDALSIAANTNTHGLRVAVLISCSVPCADGAAERCCSHQGQEAVQRHVCSQGYLWPHEGHMVRNPSGRCLVFFWSRLKTGILICNIYHTILLHSFAPFFVLRMISSPWVFIPLATHMASLMTSFTHFLSRSRLGSLLLSGYNFLVFALLM